MKSILSVPFAAVLLIGMLGGCARDMSGESRATPTPVATSTPMATSTPTATATTKPTDGAAPSSPGADSTADGVIDEGRDAVDGVVGAGEDAVNDVVDAAEDAVDDMTGNSTAKPETTPKATEKP